MDGTPTLRTFVASAGDDDLSPRPRGAETQAAEPRSSRQIVDLFMQTVRRDQSLIPDAVRELEPDGFCEWFLASLDTFALDYMQVYCDEPEVRSAVARCLS